MVMKILVCGGRDYTNEVEIRGFLDYLHKAHVIDCVVHGGARGADAIAGRVALELNIPVKVYHADWNKYGKSAGPIRNQEMIDKEHPDAVVAFPGGKGTAHMIALATKNNIPVFHCPIPNYDSLLR